MFTQLQMPMNIFMFSIFIRGIFFGAFTYSFEHWLLIDLVLLTAFMGIGVASTEITMREMIIQFILPMVVTTCICLRLFTGHFARGMVPSIIASLFWLTLWTLVVLREDIYSKVSTSIWIILMIFALLYMCYCIYRIMKETGQMYTYNMIEGI